MNTIEKIKMEGEAIVNKLKRCETLNPDERRVLKIYQSLIGGRAANAGKRNGSANVQQVK